MRWQLVSADDPEQHNPWPYIIFYANDKGGYQTHGQERFATEEEAVARAEILVAYGHRIEVYKDVAYSIGVEGTQTIKEDCVACSGSGRMPRDPDIGTDQECFVCEGAGYFEVEANQ